MIRFILLYIKEEKFFAEADKVCLRLSECRQYKPREANIFASRGFFAYRSKFHRVQTAVAPNE